MGRRAQGYRAPGALSDAFVQVLVTGTVALAGAAYWYEGFAPREALRLTVAAAVLLALVMLALLDLERLVLVVLFCSMVFPQSLVSPGGSHVALSDLLLVFALGAWVAWFAVRRHPVPWLRRNPYLAPALVFAGLTLGSVLWSTNWMFTLKQAIQIFEIVVVVPVVFASVPRSLARIRQALVTYVVFATGISVLVFYYFIRRAIAGDLSPEYLPGMHKNATGGFIGVAIVIAYGLWLEGRSGSRHVIWLLPLDLAGLFGTISRGAMVGTAVAVALLTVLMARRRLVTVALIATATVVFLVTIQWKLPETGYSSASTRPQSYAGGLRWIEAHPLFGTGAGTYSDFLPKAHIGLTDPNNLFLLTWAEIGVFGLAALLFLLYRVARTVAAVRAAPPPAAALGTTVAAAAASNLVHFQFDTTWARGTATITFALVGLVFAVVRLAPKAAPARPPALAAENAVPRALARTGPAGDRPRSLRVVQVVASTDFTGLERRIVRLAAGLREHDIDCRIACPFTAEELRFAAARAAVPVIPAAGRGNWLAQVVRSVEDNPPQLVHAHDSAGAVAGWQIAEAADSRLVRTDHSTRRASEYAAWRGRAPALLPIGVDLPSDARVERLRRRVDGLTRPAAVYCGEIVPEKELDLLILALARIRPRIPDFRLVVAGSGFGQKGLRRQALDVGVEGAIEWMGDVSDLSDGLARAQCAVVPSSFEIIDLFAAEAMAWGLPVVAARSGTSAELVSDGSTGLLFRSGDVRDLADVLIALASDLRRTEALGVAARQVALERLDVDAVVARALEIYDGSLRTEPS